MWMPKFVRKLTQPSPETVAEIRNEILEEIAAKQRKEKEEQQAEAERQRQIKEEAERRVAEQIEAEKIAKEEARAKMKLSDEPWVEVIALVQDPEKGAKIELDWNDAFIVYLKQNGFTGISDDHIIQKYIAVLLKSLVLEEEEEVEEEEDDSDSTK